MTMTSPRAARLAAALLLAGAVAMPSSARTVPDSFALGRDSDGDPCVATRTWTVGKGIKLAGDQSFTMNCRGSAQSRGYVEVPSARSTPTEAGAGCGEPRRLSVTGLGAVEARRCFDPQLALEAVELRISRPRGRWLFGHRLSGSVFGLAALGLALTAFLAPPFSGLDTLPSIGLVVLALGYLLTDIVVVAAGAVIGVLGVASVMFHGSIAVKFFKSIF